MTESTFPRVKSDSAVLAWIPAEARASVIADFTPTSAEIRVVMISLSD